MCLNCGSNTVHVVFNSTPVKNFVNFVIFRKAIYRANVSDNANSDKKFYFGLADTPLYVADTPLRYTETIQGALNMKSMRITPPNWLNISWN